MQLTRKKIIIITAVIIAILSVVGVIIKLNEKPTVVDTPTQTTPRNELGQPVAKSSDAEQYFSKEELVLIETELKYSINTNLDNVRLQKETYEVGVNSKSILVDTISPPMSYKLTVAKVPTGESTVFLECAPMQSQVGDGTKCYVDRGVGEDINND